MISSSLGWHELPYASLPFPLDGSGIVSARVTVPRRDGASHPALICSGVAADNDVMRGEECEMMGALAMPAVAQLRENALVLLPGTHTKHIRVRHGAIVDFRTYLTGELLDLLVQHSLLHHSVVMPDADNAGEAFAAGIALAGEMTLSAALFHIRAHHLLHDTSPAENGAMLNGILIGGELHELRACYSTDLPLLLCAGPRHASWFAKGCRLLGLAERLRIVLPDDAALAASRGHAIILDRATKSSIT
jgi:2-dehydro-3-deoxygalactonokinase